MGAVRERGIGVRVWSPGCDHLSGGRRGEEVGERGGMGLIEGPVARIRNRGAE